MVGELAVELVYPIPRAAVPLQAVSQALHGEVRLVEGVEETCGIFDCLVEVAVFGVPAALPSAAHPERDIACGNGAGRCLPHQVADDLLIDQLEVVKVDQIAEIPLR